MLSGLCICVSYDHTRYRGNVELSVCSCESSTSACVGGIEFHVTLTTWQLKSWQTSKERAPKLGSGTGISDRHEEADIGIYPFAFHCLLRAGSSPQTARDRIATSRHHHVGITIPLAQPRLMHQVSPNTMSYFATPPLTGSRAWGVIKKKKQPKIWPSTAKYLSIQKHTPVKVQNQRLRHEVIKVDSTHHAIRKIGQHVCFVYGGGTSIG